MSDWDAATMDAMLPLPRIEYLADEASLERGRDYFRRGLVLRATTHSDGTVDGVVEGENLYRVTLRARSWSCDCPIGVQGVFCKHCVAVALAAREAPGTDAASARPDASDASLAAGSLAAAQKRILSAFRTRRELYRWSAVSEYASVAYAAVDELREAAGVWGAAALIPTVQKAIASTVRVILRADDSNGVIGTVIDDLLSLHAQLCTAAPPPVNTLVDWLIAFQFDGTQDFFNPDIVDYSGALGEIGLRRFGEKLDTLDGQLEAQPTDTDSVIFRYNRQRLAVAQRDVPGIVASFGELAMSYRLHDVAKALIEVGAVDQAIAYAERGALLDSGWQAEKAGQYWCELLHEHRTHDDEIAARQLVFDRWPTATNAVRLAKAAGDAWATRAEDAYAKLEQRHPRELIETLLGLDLTDRAWREAQRHPLDAQLWTRLVAVQQEVDPASVVPVLRELIDTDLEVSDARNYKSAVKRLKQLRSALKAVGREDEFAPIVASLQDEHRRRPRLLEELRRAGF
ncbi:MAG: SWIM zinc finger family protein [Lacisediminihabitans sp.]